MFELVELVHKSKEALESVSIPVLVVAVPLFIVVIAGLSTAVALALERAVSRPH